MYIYPFDSHKPAEDLVDPKYKTVSNSVRPQTAPRRRVDTLISVFRPLVEGQTDKHGQTTTQKQNKIDPQNKTFIYNTQWNSCLFV